MAGMSRFFTVSWGPTVEGSRLNFTPITYWNTKPMTKLGTAMTMSEITRTVESKMPPRRIPAMKPKPTPMTVSKISAITASLMVTGNALAMTELTG